MTNDKDLKYTLSLKDLFSGKMAKAVDQTRQMDSTMSGMGSKLKSLAMGFGVAGLGKMILDTGAGFERAEIQLKTLLKSADAAKAVFNDLKDEATRSPFGFETLLQGNAALISAGVSAKNAKEDFNALANAIAATGGTEDHLQRMIFNLQQIKNTGKATGADIRQFGMANINITQMLEEYYKKNHISLSKQKRDYDDIVGALKMAAGEGGKFFGALDNLANSTSGRLSNLSDKAKNFAYEIFNQLKPAINAVVEGLTALMGLILKLLPAIKIGITLWGAYIIKLKIGKIESYNFALAQRAMAMGMSKSAIATGFLSRGIRGIGAAIKAVPIIGWIAAIVEGIMYLWDTFEGFRGAVYEVVDVFKNMGSTLSEIFTGVGNQIKGFFTGNEQLSKLGRLQVAHAQVSAALSSVNAREKGIDAFRKEHGVGNLSAAAMGASGAGGAGGAGADGGSGGLGSSTDISATRPQSLVINIGKMVEKFELHSTNVTEGFAKIKDKLGEMLVEVANDANIVAKV